MTNRTRPLHGRLPLVRGEEHGRPRDRVSPGNRKINFAANASVVTSASGQVNCNGTTPLSLNTWYLITASKDGSNVCLYVNGNLDKTCAYTGTDTNSNTWQIAHHDYPTTEWSYQFDGRIDDVRIYNRALTAGEVKQLYNMGR